MARIYLFNGRQVPEPKANQYAIDQHGQLIHISEANPKEKDGYQCTYCGETLTMNLGEKKTHHFSHRRDSGCSGAETELHLQCKEIIGHKSSNSKRQFVNRFGLPCFKSTNNPQFNIRRQIGTVKNIRIEQAIYLDGKMYRPDMLVEFFPDERRYPNVSFDLAIEIRCKNPVDIPKRQAMRKAKFPCIEVDMRAFKPGLQDIDDMDYLFKGRLDNRAWIQPPVSELGFSVEDKPLSVEQSQSIELFQSMVNLRNAEDLRMIKYNDSLADPRMKRLTKTTNLQVTEEFAWLDEIREYDHHFGSPTFEYRAAILLKILGRAVRDGKGRIGALTLNKAVRQVCDTYEQFDCILPTTLARSGIPSEVRERMPDYRIGVRQFMRECEEKGLVRYATTPRELYILYPEAINRLCEAINPIIEKDEVRVVLPEEIIKMQCVRGGQAIDPSRPIRLKDHSINLDEIEQSDSKESDEDDDPFMLNIVGKGSGPTKPNKRESDFPDFL